MSGKFREKVVPALSLAAVFDGCSLYDNIRSRVTPRCTGFTALVDRHSLRHSDGGLDGTHLTRSLRCLASATITGSTKSPGLRDRQSVIPLEWELI